MHLGRRGFYFLDKAVINIFFLMELVTEIALLSFLCASPISAAASLSVPSYIFFDDQGSASMNVVFCIVPRLTFNPLASSCL